MKGQQHHQQHINNAGQSIMPCPSVTFFADTIDPIVISDNEYPYEKDEIIETKSMASMSVSPRYIQNQQPQIYADSYDNYPTYQQQQQQQQQQQVSYSQRHTHPIKLRQPNTLPTQMTTPLARTTIPIIQTKQNKNNINVNQNCTLTPPINNKHFQTQQLQQQQQQGVITHNNNNNNTNNKYRNRMLQRKNQARVQKQQKKKQQLSPQSQPRSQPQSPQSEAAFPTYYGNNQYFPTTQCLANFCFFFVFF